jgi:hypothetical protein
LLLVTLFSKADDGIRFFNKGDDAGGESRDDGTFVEGGLSFCEV